MYCTKQFLVVKKILLLWVIIFFNIAVDTTYIIQTFLHTNIITHFSILILYMFCIFYSNSTRKRIIYTFCACNVDNGNIRVNAHDHHIMYTTEIL